MIHSAFKSYTSREAYRYLRYIHKEGIASTSKIASDLDKHSPNVSTPLNEFSSPELSFLQYNKVGRSKDYQLHLDGMFEWWRDRIIDTAEVRLNERGEEKKEFEELRNSTQARHLFKQYIKNYLENNEKSTVSDMLEYDFKYFVERYEDQLEEKGYGEAVELIQEVYFYATKSEAELKFLDNIEEYAEVKPNRE
jgi:hypothetical protein